jgi:hypothetical protein
VVRLDFEEFMASPTVPYVLGGTQTEQQRLAAQAQGLENPTRWMLDQINIKPGSSFWYPFYRLRAPLVVTETLGML